MEGHFISGRHLQSIAEGRWQVRRLAAAARSRGRSGRDLGDNEQKDKTDASCETTLRKMPSCATGKFGFHDVHFSFVVF